LDNDIIIIIIIIMTFICSELKQ